MDTHRSSIPSSRGGQRDELNGTSTSDLNSIRAPVGPDHEALAHALSHDLSAPLRSILGFAQLLEDECGDELSDDARLFVGNMTDGARRLGAQLRALVTYLRLDPVDKPCRVSLARVLSEVQGQLSDAVDQAGTTITVSNLPFVQGDHAQLRSLFLHLLDNALKFRGETPARIVVSCKSGPHRVLITVRDHGIGFDQKLVPRAFGLFRQLHPFGTYPGVGIGLSICRSVVSNHGGELLVESSVGIGTTASFSLPLDTSGYTE